MIKIITLIENEKSKDKPELINEFGLSFYIEDDEKSFIFDTGQTGNFLDNAHKMNINLKNIHDIILSHSHYDHTGGLKKFTNEISKNFTLHINKSFFDEKYKIENNKYIFLGNNFDEKFIHDNKIKINFINNDTYRISKNIILHTNFKKLNDFEELLPYYVRKINDNFIIDKMDDEIALEIKTQNGIYIIVGCSHIGICNIIENIKNRSKEKIIGVIGGLHLTKASNMRINKVLKYFMDNDIKYFGTSHCTGENFLNKVMTLKNEDITIFPNHTGDEIIL